MKYGYARVSTDGQSVDAQVRQLTKAGCKKVFREVASGAKIARAQLRRLLDQLEAGDVLTVTPHKLTPHQQKEGPSGATGARNRFPRSSAATMSARRRFRGWRRRTGRGSWIF
jgi:Resolvase, N terminal domain